MNFETIKEKYMKNYITDAQLDRFAKLGIITSEQVEQLRAEKYPPEASAEQSDVAIETQQTETKTTKKRSKKTEEA